MVSERWAKRSTVTVSSFPRNWISDLHFPINLHLHHHRFRSLESPSLPHSSSSISSLRALSSSCIAPISLFQLRLYSHRSSDWSSMGKRKCNSKYRTSTPSQAEDDLSSPRNNPRNADLSPEGSGSSNRAAVLRPPNPAPSQSRTFEVSDSPDNLHSPYHLLNSDHPGLVLVSESLDGSNYGTWIVAMTTSLEAKNKLGFVDGSIPKPELSDPYYKIWCRINSMLKSWLLNSVTNKIYTSILYFSMAADMWKDLHTRFHKSNLPRLYKLRHQLLSLRQGTMDLSSYHTQTQMYWEELSSIQAHATTVEELLAQRETNRVIDFLMGLNESYDHVRSQILMKKTLPSLSEVFNILDNEDSQRSARISIRVQRKNSKKQKEHIRCWKIICIAIFLWWFLWGTLNTNGRQQHQQKQRSANPLGLERNMEPRFQTSFRCYNAVAVVYAFFKRKQLVFFDEYVHARRACLAVTRKCLIHIRKEISWEKKKISWSSVLYVHIYVKRTKKLRSLVRSAC